MVRDRLLFTIMIYETNYQFLTATTVLLPPTTKRITNYTKTT